MIIECTVCEKQIGARESAFAITEQEEQTLFFCSERCLQAFEEDPELFADEDYEEARSQAE